VEGQVVTANLSGERDVLDTQLSALPSTGGIGTTIFTIAGCLIMVAAAGLFFVSRRKSAK
jgi:LPXTG-motif cell wall-anchored protein